MDTQIIFPHHLQSHQRPLQPTSQDKTHTSILPRECPTRPYEYHGQLRRFPKKEIVGLFTNFHFPKRRAKPWKREVHLLEIIFSETCRHVIHFLKSENGHIGVIPHHHNIMRTKGEGQGRWGRRMEVGGGDLGGGRVRGDLAPLFFIFPSHLPFLGFPLTTSL